MYRTLLGVSKVFVLIEKAMYRSELFYVNDQAKAKVFLG